MLRLSEAKIKEAMVHPEKIVREEALNYFTECYSQDPEVMPRAIDAIAMYGRDQAFLQPHVLANVAQTEATVDWTIQELYRKEEQATNDDTYCTALSNILCNADPQLLVARAQEILQAPSFLKSMLPVFQERLQLQEWDAGQCWKEIEQICEKNKGKNHPEDVNFGRVKRIVARLASQGKEYTDRILDLLNQKVENYKNDPMLWMEIFLVMLAGEMRLEVAIPRIVAKLHDMGEILSEECVTALAKIGSSSAIELVTDHWSQSDWDYRLYAVGALEKIHADVTVQKCLELLPLEKELDIRTLLAAALLGQFAWSAIEPVCQIIRSRKYDRLLSDLPRHLIAVSTLLDVTFPEHAVWKQEVTARYASQEQKIREMRTFVHSPAPASLPAELEKQEDFWQKKATPFMRTEEKVGRNDPCPCGSGKKYKKCCMKRDQS